MSDGPFKNLKLGRRWKRFVVAVQNDAFGSAECCALAQDALIREILTDDVKALLIELQAYANKHLDFSMDSSFIEDIFNRHSKTSFSDILQKEVECRLSEGIVLSEVILQSIEAAAREQVNEARSRIVEECIVARDYKGMWQEEFNRTVKQSSGILDSLSMSDICKVVLSGNQNAFKAAASKKVGLDEGVDI